MTLITWRDMQWRARRIVIGVAAAALVLAISALLQALHQGFLDETDRTVDFFGADTWVVPRDVSGPFTSNSPVPVADVDPLVTDLGADRVTPVAIFRHVVTGAEASYTDVNVIAYAPDGVVRPDIVAGRAPQSVGEVAVDARLDAEVGDTLKLAGRRLSVVGQVDGLTYNGGTPTVLLTLREGQLIAYDGQDLASAFVVSGDPTTLPSALTTMSRSQVRDDLRRPLSIATTAIGLVAALLWVVAGGIVAMLAFLSGLDRHRDFAVFKANGVATKALVVSQLLESALVSLAAGVLALVLARGLLPMFPVTISLSGAESLQLLALAVAVGLVAATLSIRGVVRVDPAIAFANT